MSTCIGRAMHGGDHDNPPPWVEKVVDGLWTALERTSRSGVRAGTGASTSGNGSGSAEGVLVSAWETMLGEHDGGCFAEVLEYGVSRRLVGLASSRVVAVRGGRGGRGGQGGQDKVGSDELTSAAVSLAVRILIPAIRYTRAPTCILQSGIDIEGVLDACLGLLSVVPCGGRAGRDEEGGVEDDKGDFRARRLVVELVEVLVCKGRAFEGVRHAAASMAVKNDSGLSVPPVKVFTTAVSRIGALVVKHKKGEEKEEEEAAGVDRLGLYHGALRAGLLAYPQALKGHVDRLWDVCDWNERGAGATAVDYGVWVLLPRVSGEKEVWGRAVGVIMGRLHACLDLLLAGLEDASSQASASSSASMNALPKPDDAKTAALVAYLKTQATFAELVTHAHALFDALGRLLSAAFPTAVPFPITTVVDLAARLLRVDTTRIDMIERVGRTVGQVGTLGVHVAGLQVDACELLQGVLARLGCHVVPYMGLVFGVVERAMEHVVGCMEGGRVDGRLVRGVVGLAGAGVRVDGVAGVRALEDVVVELVRIEVYGDDGDDHQDARSFQPATKESLAPILRFLALLFARGASALKHANRLWLEDVVLHVAKTAHRLVERKRVGTNLDTATESSLLEAALEALEAAVVAPSVYRPAHAAEALRLMRACGRDCGRLEMAIHPRSLDLRVRMDESSNALGVPRFWLGSTDAVDVNVTVNVVNVGGDPNVGGRLPMDPPEEAEEAEEASRVQRNTSKRPARAAIATRVQSQQAEGDAAAAKRFKVVLGGDAPNDGKDGEDGDDGKDGVVQRPDDGSSDEDDYLAMLDSGGEDEW